MGKDWSLVGSGWQDSGLEWHMDVSYLGKQQGRFHSLLAVVNGGSKRCVGLFFMLDRDFKGPEVVSCLEGLLEQVEKGLLSTKKPESIHVYNHAIFTSGPFIDMCEAYGLRVVHGGRNARNPVENFFHRFKTACFKLFHFKVSDRTWRNLKVKCLTVQERKWRFGQLRLSKSREKLFATEAFFRFIRQQPNLDHLLVELNLRHFEGFGLSRLTLDVVLAACSKSLVNFRAKALLESPSLYMANSAMRGGLLSQGQALEQASNNRVGDLSLDEARKILQQHEALPESLLSVLFHLALNIQNLNVGQNVGFTQMNSQIGGLKSQVEALTGELQRLTLELKRRDEEEALKKARRDKRKSFGREVPTASVLSPDQFERLVPYARRKHPESLVLLRHRLTAVLLYATGMRISNCLKLTVSDVKTLYSTTPAFYSSRVKTQKEERIYISSERSQVVLNHKREFLHYVRKLGLKPTDLVFANVKGKNKGKAFSRAYFTNSFNTYMKQRLGADTKALKQSSKGFRMGLASNLLERTNSLTVAKEGLGHKSEATTQSYITNSDDFKRNRVKRLDKILKENPQDQSQGLDSEKPL